MLRKRPVPFRYFLTLRLPAAIASAVAGTVFSHRSGPAVATATGAPAGAEMMRVLRDEHALLGNYLRDVMARRQQADLAAEREILQAKAETRAVALAAPVIDKPKQKLAASQRAQEPGKQTPIKTAAALPLQLVQVADAAAALEPPVTFARGEEGPIRTRLRRVTAVVRRIPSWAHSVAEWISDTVPSVPKASELNILKLSS